MKTLLALGAAMMKHFYWIWLGLLGVFAGARLFKFAFHLF